VIALATPRPRYAVVVPQLGDAPAGAYHYHVPEGLNVVVGHLVVVPFGPRRVQGVVLDMAELAPVDETRPIEGVVDARPILTTQQIALARWVAERYLVPLGRVLGAMVPAGLRSTFDQQLSLRRGDAAAATLGPRERQVVEYLRERGPARLRTLRERLELPRAHELAVRLVRRGLVERRPVMVGPPRRPDAPSLVVLAEAGVSALAGGELARSPRQAEVLELLRRQPSGRADLEFLRAETGVEARTVRMLAERGWLRVEAAPAPIRAAARLLDPARPLRLTAEQEAALARLTRGLDRKGGGAFLLHGVTASGKTEVYIRLIQAALQRGRRAIVLVPEIALTPQAIHRFGSRFPGRVVALHSRLGPRDRFDAWRRIRDGRADVVVGSRSALLAPVPELGVVVVDEEHEPSYKQPSAPRYHGREAALALGRIAGAVVVLGSATPDVETYERSWRGEIELVEMSRRVRGQPMPAVEVVDLRQAVAHGENALFSPRLVELLGETLARREQSILFLNRRGAATVVICASCGWVPRCRRCDVTEVYHAIGDELLCHQCNRRERPPTTCPGCRSTRLQYLGAGTQRVVMEVQRLFPTARVLRWDKDAMRRKLAAEQLTELMTEGRADVLVGTQAIAKGLDLPGVTLVGIVSADTVLHLPDMRAAERTFQLLTQVAGRAGRGGRPGRVVLQTYSPEHACVLAAARQNYGQFVQTELRFRREHGYPPYAELVRAVYASSGPAAARAACAKQAAALRAARPGVPAAAEIIGPAPCYYGRVRGRYRWQLLLRGPGSRDLAGSVAWAPGWAVDVDPISLL
jgi:primosomal protein N' (replication factor Y)